MVGRRVGGGCGHRVGGRRLGRDGGRDDHDDRRDATGECPHSYRDDGGEGGPAIRAKLCLPWGVAVDGQGNVYIADGRNHRVRRVSPSGTITTVAGNGDLSSQT